MAPKRKRDEDGKGSATSKQRTAKEAAAADGKDGKGRAARKQRTTKEADNGKEVAVRDRTLLGTSFKLFTPQKTCATPATCTCWECKSDSLGRWIPGPDDVHVIILGYLPDILLYYARCARQVRIPIGVLAYPDWARSIAAPTDKHPKPLTLTYPNWAQRPGADKISYPAKYDKRLDFLTAIAQGAETVVEYLRDTYPSRIFLETAKAPKDQYAKPRVSQSRREFMNAVTWATGQARDRRHYSMVRLLCDMNLQCGYGHIHSAVKHQRTGLVDAMLRDGDTSWDRRAVYTNRLESKCCEYHAQLAAPAYSKLDSGCPVDRYIEGARDLATATLLRKHGYTTFSDDSIWAAIASGDTALVAVLLPNNPLPIHIARCIMHAISTNQDSTRHCLTRFIVKQSYRYGEVNEVYKWLRAVAADQWDTANQLWEQRWDTAERRYNELWKKHDSLADRFQMSTDSGRISLEDVLSHV